MSKITKKVRKAVSNKRKYAEKKKKETKKELKEYKKPAMKMIATIIFFLLSLDLWNYFVENQSLTQKLFEPIIQINLMSFVLVFGFFALFSLFLWKESGDK